MQWILAVREFLGPLLGWISNTKIFNFLPLNFTLHFFVSIGIFYYLAGRGYRAITCIIIVFGLGLLKEIFDLPATLTNGEYLESLTDLLVDGLGTWAGYYLSRPVENTEE